MNHRTWIIWAIGAVLLPMVESKAEDEAIEPGDRVRVVSSAPVKVQRDVVGTLSEGTEVVVQQVRDPWLLVDSGSVRGWIHRCRVQKIGKAEPDEQEAPELEGGASGTTIELLSSYMTRLGYRHMCLPEIGEREGMIVSGFSFGPQGFSVTVCIDVIAEKGALLMKVPRIFHAPLESGSEHRVFELLKAIGYINYSIILGKFCYDPRDGEVSFAVNMAIDDAVLTFAQFKHSLEVLLGELQEKVPKLRAIHAGEVGPRMCCCRGWRFARLGCRCPRRTHLKGRWRREEPAWTL